MAVVAMLSQKNIIPTPLNTEAILTMEGLSITKIHLSITASVPGMNADDFTTVTKEAEKNILISKVLSIPISSEAHFNIG